DAGAASTAKKESAPAKAEQPAAPAAAASAPAQPAPAAPTPTAAPATSADQPLSPAVRRVVTEEGLDVAGVQGTGPHGRLTKGEVLDLAAQRKAKLGDGASSGAATATAAAPAPAPRPAAPADHELE